MDNQLPDYRISMLTGILLGPRLEHRAFSVYIDSTVRNENGGEDITGRIDDSFGEGFITGNIDSTKCSLAIKYGADAIKNGAPEGILMYEGTLRKSAYIGGFKLMSITREEEYSDNKIFAMKKFNPKNMLDDKPTYLSDSRNNSSWN